MLLASLAILIGLPVLLWSAGKFVGGAASVANHFGVSPLLIGMLIIGFGTSAPEIIVSIFAAIQGNSGIALGNAYGSNIANILLILGLTAVISPIAVKSEIIKKELPVLLGITFFAVWQVWDLQVSKDDAFSLLGLFVLLLSWSIYHGMKGGKDALADEYDASFVLTDSELRCRIGRMMRRALDHVGPQTTMSGFLLGSVQSGLLVLHRRSRLRRAAFSPA